MIWSGESSIKIKENQNLSTIVLVTLMSSDDFLTRKTLVPDYENATTGIRVRRTPHPPIVQDPLSPARFRLDATNCTGLNQVAIEKSPWYISHPITSYRIRRLMPEAKASNELQDVATTTLAHQRYTVTNLRLVLNRLLQRFEIQWNVPSVATVISIRSSLRKV